MVQAWYSGGLSVFDWTDAANPKEIAYFDRGPVDPSRLRSGGYWSTYWYNGYIYGSEMARGLDVFELTPSPLLSQDELDAAKSVRFDYYNVQGQQKFVWPATVGLARAYLDQLERSKGLSAAGYHRGTRVAGRRGEGVGERAAGRAHGAGRTTVVGEDARRREGGVARGCGEEAVGKSSSRAGQSNQERTKKTNVILSEAKEPCPDAWLLRFAQDDSVIRSSAVRSSRLPAARAPVPASALRSAGSPGVHPTTSTPRPCR